MNYLTMRRVWLVGKRLFDFLGSLAGLLFLFPLFAIVAVFIKIEDGGPVFFRQYRLGLGGNPFGIWKFRTMIQDADLYIDKDGKPTRERVTRVGRFLRKSSIDELPQLINILVGEMSVVGPRPALLSHYPRYTDVQRRRLLMKPGITGLAQINGRNTLKWSRRIDFDIEYIERFSLPLDMVIIMKTARQVIFGAGVVMDRNSENVDDLLPPRDGVDVPCVGAKGRK